MEIISILIAFVSLCISFVSLLISRGVAPVIHKSGIDVTVHGDGIDMLFAECDTPCDDFNNPDICHACDKLNVRNKQIIRMVNKNNRDILVFLQAGYVCNDNRKYHIKPEYFKLMANDVTEIHVEIDIGKIENHQDVGKDYAFVFEYQGLLFKRRKKIHRKR